MRKETKSPSMDPRPIAGNTILDIFSLSTRSKWTSLIYGALTIPVLFVAFYIAVRTVRHEKR